MPIRWPWSKRPSDPPPDEDLAELPDLVDDELEDVTGTFERVAAEGRKKSRAATESIERVVEQTAVIREAKRETQIAANLTRECAQCYRERREKVEHE